MRRLLLLLVAACAAPAAAPRAPARAAAPRDPGPYDLHLGDPAWHVPGTVDAIAFSRDERRLIVGSQEGGVLVYDLASGDARARVRDLGDVHRVSLIDDAHALVSRYREGDAAAIVRVDLARGAATPLVPGASEAAVLPRDPRAAVVAWEEEGRDLSVVDLATGATRVTLARSAGFDQVTVVGGRATATRDDVVGVWDVATGARLARFGGPRPAALSPDGASIATGTFYDAGGWTIDVYAIADGAKLGAFAHGTCNPNAAAFSPDGRWLATGCEDGVRVWDLRAGGLVAALDAHLDYARALAFAPSGRWLAAGGNDDTLYVWDTASWTVRPIGDAHRGDVHGLAVSPDGASVLSWSFVDPEARLWDVRSGRATVLATGRGVQAGAIAHGGALLATWKDRDAAIDRWRADGVRAETRSLGGAAGATPIFRGIAATPGGGVVVVHDGAAHVLDRELAPAWDSPKVTPDDLGNDEVAFTRDGAKVAIAGEGGALMLVDVAARRARGLGARGCGSVYALAWSPDGARLALADGTSVVRVLDAERGAELLAAALPAHALGLELAPDGHVVVLARDGLYDVDPRGAVTRAPAPDASAVALSPDGASIWLGLRDGTLARMSRAAAARAATAVPAAAAPDLEHCPADEGLSGFGTIGGHVRGKLPDDDQ